MQSRHQTARQAAAPIYRQALFVLEQARMELEWARRSEGHPRFRAVCLNRAAQMRRIAAQHFDTARREASRQATVQKASLTLNFASAA